MFTYFYVDAVFYFVHASMYLTCTFTLNRIKPVKQLITMTNVSHCALAAESVKEALFNVFNFQISFISSPRLQRYHHPVVYLPFLITLFVAWGMATGFLSLNITCFARLRNRSSSRELRLLWSCFRKTSRYDYEVPLIYNLLKCCCLIWIEIYLVYGDFAVFFLFLLFLLISEHDFGNKM